MAVSDRQRNPQEQGTQPNAGGGVIEGEVIHGGYAQCKAKVEAERMAEPPVGESRSIYFLKTR